MKTKILLLFAMGALLFSCTSNTTVKEEHKIKYTTDGISVESIEITDSKGKSVELNNLIYGQKIHVIFKHVDGFRKENNILYPGLKILILSSNDDTVLYTNDAYSNIEELNIQNNVLTSIITLGYPMKSNESYRAYLLLWDKKSKGQLVLEFTFTLKPDPNLTITTNKVQYDEIYLWDENNEEVILSNEIKSNTTYYLMFEGLKGFVHHNDSVYFGLSMKITNSQGEVYTYNPDLSNNVPYAFTDFSKRVAPYFKIKSLVMNNPVKVEAKIWDKKSDAYIQVSFSSNVEWM